MLTVGASKPCACLRLVSIPRRVPPSRTSAGFHVAPSAVPQGKFADGRPDHCSPRAPLGPSVTFSGGMPRRSTPGPCHRSIPATGPALSSSVNSATSFEILSLMALILCHDAAMEQLDGKVAVVTGAASGIGWALAQRLVAEGMRVVAADVEPFSSTGVHPYTADVSRYEDVAALADHAYTTFGAVDVLCNNAGVFTGGLMWERPATDFSWTLGVNLWGILHAVRAFVPRMIEAGTPAHIVNTVSMAGLCTNAFSSPYTVSKFAALAATECLAHDLAAMGAPIKVSAVVPGSVATSIGASRRNRPADLAESRTEDAAFVEQTLIDFTSTQGAPPEDVAAMIIDAIRAEQFLVPTRASYAEQLRSRMDALIAKTLPPMPDFD